MEISIEPPTPADRARLDRVATTYLATCAGRPQSLFQQVAQAIGIVAMLVVLTMLVVVAASVAFAGRAYHTTVDDAKIAGHSLVEYTAGLAHSPLVSRAVTAGQVAQKDLATVRAVPQTAKATVAPVISSKACYDWLASRQGTVMAGGAGTCPAAKQAVADAQAGGSPTCPVEPGGSPRSPTYHAFLDAQCPWQRSWHALRPNS